MRRNKLQEAKKLVVTGGVQTLTDLLVDVETTSFSVEAKTSPARLRRILADLSLLRLEDAYHMSQVIGVDDKPILDMAHNEYVKRRRKKGSQNPSALPDEEYLVPRNLLVAGGFKNFSELIAVIHKTPFSRLAKTTPERFNRILANPGLARLSDIYNFAQVFCVDDKIILNLVYNDFNRLRRKKKNG